MKYKIYFSPEYYSFTLVDENTTNLDVLLEPDAVLKKEFECDNYDEARKIYNQEISLIQETLT